SLEFRPYRTEVSLNIVYISKSRGVSKYYDRNFYMKPGTDTSRLRILSSARLFDDNPRWRAAIGVFAGDLVPDAGGHLAEDDGVRVVGVGDSDRGAAVGGFADLEVERHLAQKLGAEALGFLAGAAMREDLAAASAMRAQEIAHVFDDA